LRVPRRRRFDRSFLELVGVLFILGIVFELLYLSVPKAGGTWWLWFVPGMIALLGLLWLVSRAPQTYRLPVPSARPVSPADPLVR